jgi:molybdopterin-guanine dinucleotide biosynthesis protein B
MARLRGEPPLTALLARMPEVDIILIEGFRYEAPVRIEVYRTTLSSKPLCLSEEGFLALVSDAEVEGIAIPRFRPDDVERLAEFLVKKLLRRR